MYTGLKMTPSSSNLYIAAVYSIDFVFGRSNSLGIMWTDWFHIMISGYHLPVHGRCKILENLQTITYTTART